MATLGFIYSSFYYDKFGISYLEHAEISDLIGVVFVHPHFLFSILVFRIGLFIYLTVTAMLNSEASANSDNYTIFKVKKYGIKIALFIFFSIVIFAPYIIVTDKITDIKQYRLPIYEITLVKNSSLIKCAVSIGSTTNNLFYWDVVRKESIILPKRNITKIRVILASPPAHLSAFDKRVIKWEEKVTKACGMNR